MMHESSPGTAFSPDEKKCIFNLDQGKSPLPSDDFMNIPAESY
jgi:hypothetical protein